MRIGKIEFRENVIKNNMTGQTMAKFMEEHCIPLETIYIEGGLILFVICKWFKDLDDTALRIPEYKVVLHREEGILGLLIAGITDEKGVYVYDQRH